MKIIPLKKEYVSQTAEILVEAYWNSVDEAKNELFKKIKSNECFIALENKEVAGVFIYMKNYSHYANYLEDLVVSKKYRGQGVANRLLEKYILISRGETPKKQKYALSSTHSFNKISIKTHLKSGFKKIGLIRGLHYGKDEIFFGYNLRRLR